MNTLTPEEVGFSSERLQRLHHYMQGLVNKNILAGVMTILARRGEVFDWQNFGMMDIEANKAMQADTIFRIYSMTKPMASMALMMLYEEAHFQLDDLVSKYIPQFRNLMVLVNVDSKGIWKTDPKHEITFRHLLTHTAGLGYGLFNDSPLEDMYRATKILSPLLKFQVSLEEMIKRLAELPLAHHPGTAWRYSMATDVVGYLVSLIADMPFDTFLEEKILNPLGLNDTAFYVPPEKVERLAAMYGPTPDNPLTLVDSPTSSPFTNLEYTPSGGAGLVSTATDYLRFTRMLLNGGELDGVRLLSQKTIKLMTANHLPPEHLPLHLGDTTLSGYGFGLGFRSMIDVPLSGVLGTKGEYGWGGAAGTYFWIDPQLDIIGLMMTQYLPASMLPLPIRDIFKTLTYQAFIE